MPNARAPNPVLVEVTRGPMVESRHRGAAVIADANGKIIESWGDIAAQIYPRSAIKPLQALPLIESGAADAYGLGPQELALACASHSGETFHVERVAAWLDKIHCTMDDFECGTHIPMGEAAAMELAARGEKPTTLHNNCSGKHAGFLTLAKHLGIDPKGYVNADHPIQKMIFNTVHELTACDMTAAPCGIDGCSIPTWATPLSALASGWAKMAAPDDLPAKRADASRRLLSAMAAHPHLVAGTDRFCTVAMAAGKGRFMVKTGAEGVFCGAVPELGLGFAVKTDDGATRAAECITAALLHRLDMATPKSLRAKTPITNRRSVQVGEIRPTSALLV